MGRTERKESQGPLLYAAGFKTWKMILLPGSPAKPCQQEAPAGAQPPERRKACASEVQCRWASLQHLQRVPSPGYHSDVNMAVGCLPSPCISPHPHNAHVASPLSLALASTTRQGLKVHCEQHRPPKCPRAWQPLSISTPAPWRYLPDLGNLFPGGSSCFSQLIASWLNLLLLWPSFHFVESIPYIQVWSLKFSEWFVF